MAGVTEAWVLQLAAAVLGAPDGATQDSVRAALRYPVHEEYVLSHAFTTGGPPPLASPPVSGVKRPLPGTSEEGVAAASRIVYSAAALTEYVEGRSALKALMDQWRSCLGAFPRREACAVDLGAQVGVDRLPDRATSIVTLRTTLATTGSPPPYWESWPVDAGIRGVALSPVADYFLTAGVLGLVDRNSSTAGSTTPSWVISAHISPLYHFTEATFQEDVDRMVQGFRRVIHGRYLAINALAGDQSAWRSEHEAVLRRWFASLKFRVFDKVRGPASSPPGFALMALALFDLLADHIPSPAVLQDYEKSAITDFIAVATRPETRPPPFTSSSATWYVERYPTVRWSGFFCPACGNDHNAADCPYITPSDPRLSIIRRDSSFHDVAATATAGQTAFPPPPAIAGGSGARAGPHTRTRGPPARDGGGASGGGASAHPPASPSAAAVTVRGAHGARRGRGGAKHGGADRSGGQARRDSPSHDTRSNAKAAATTE